MFFASTVSLKIFWAARFNDRLLGAVAVSPGDGRWRMFDLCVRKTTRRRGVGSRLLALISAAANRDGVALSVAGSQLTLADQMLLKRLGYQLTRSGDDFQLDLPTGESGK